MVRTMNLRRTISLAALLVLALWGGLWIWKRGLPALPASLGEPVGAAPETSLEDRMAALQTDLAAERDARLGLEAEVEMLRMMLDDFAGGARRGPAPGDAPPSGESPPAEGAAPVAPEVAAAGSGESLWFDASVLRESGVPLPEIERLEGLFEESELQVLYLRDRATREGWAGTPRFLQEMYELRAGLRATVGDETFDWLLYATRRSNRVLVRSLLATGPGAQAGIRTGDLILRYDGKSIFKWGELQSATMQGDPGRMVPVEVMSSDGVTRRVTVPSGPLGIQLAPVIHPPQPGR
jgi:hypothetical protein